jgi:GNAT acetyltransferase-like protein
MLQIGRPAEILPAIERAWRLRQAESWNGEPAATWEWISRAALDAQYLLLLGTPERPLACLGISGKRPYGLAVSLGRRGRFAPCPGTMPSELAEALRETPRRIPISLRLVESPIADALAGMRGAVRRDHGDYLVVPPQAWHDYSRARSQKLRWTLKRGREKFTALQGAELSVLPTGGTAASLSELAAVEARGHRVKALLSDAFAAEVITRLDVGECVETQVARIDGEIVAYAIAFVSPTRVVGYTMTFRRDLTGFSLGSLLVAAQIKSALEHGREFDLGPGSSDFKHRFGDVQRPLWGIWVLPPGVRTAARTAIPVGRTIRAFRRRRESRLRT